ncbi:MAG: hypothetical protein U1C96_12795 [Gallionella sp.]|nr:hypothetical protein [Gallionella sp.]
MMMLPLESTARKFPIPSDITMNDPVKTNDNTRPAALIFLSLFVHLFILFALSGPLAGSDHAALQASGAEIRQPLTVMLQTTAAYPQGMQANVTEGKPAPAQTSIGTTTDTAQPDQPSRYFVFSELDQLPSIMRNSLNQEISLPAAPEETGTVMRVWIDRTGKVVRVEPVSPKLTPSLIAKTRADLLKSSFSPGRKRGEAVDTVIEVTIYAPAG